MKRRSRENSVYWNRKMDKLFKEYPDSKRVHMRWKAIYKLLEDKYPEIVKSAHYEIIFNFLKDADYLNRKIRWETEGIDKEKKKILSQEYQIEELGYEPTNKQRTLI